MDFGQLFKGNKRFKKKSQKNLGCSDKDECERKFNRLSKKEKEGLLAQSGECPCQLD